MATLTRGRAGRVALALAALGLTAGLLAGGLTGGEQKGSAREVKVTAKATKPDESGKQVVTVTIAINKGWYIYANPTGNEDFEPNKTEVTVGGKVKPASVKVEYPAGELVQDKIIGSYRIYTDKVDIRATVQRAAGDAGPLDVSVNVNACNKKGLCLPQSKVTLTVP